MAGIYDVGLDKNPANFAPLTPLSFLERTADVYPDHPAVVYGEIRRTWRETRDRVHRLAGALHKRGIGRGDTVAVLCANIPEMFEAHFGIPLSGAVLNTLNTRLDAEALAFMLNHGEAKALLVDPEFSALAQKAVALSGRKPLVVDVLDATFQGGGRVGDITYDALLAEGDPVFPGVWPVDEWDAISLNYTSGTTGDPKGVVYHHRGAHLNAVGNVVTWDMGRHPVYLWTLPMFHCNGWCFPWTLAVAAGTAVCLRAVRADAVFHAFKAEGVTHFCGAPIVLNTLANAPDAMKAGTPAGIQVMTAGAAPPAAVIENMEKQGFKVSHVYGLTETYGPAVVCAWREKWDALPSHERAALKARQGVRYALQEGLMVADPATMEPVPADGETMGEIFMRGNIVMRGYLKNPKATEKEFKGGWFHTGDLAVMHPDGYVEIRDRSKDIIISGGENISSIEVEGVLYRHPAVMEAAVVARPDATWGETPCAFVTLRPGAEASEADIIAHCRANLARFKAPKSVVFGPLPKTSTGKIQKFVLRAQAKAL